MDQNLVPDTKTWEYISKLLPPRDSDLDFWWNKTGPQLAALIEAAHYPLYRQYETFLFFYHWMIPYLGKALSPCSDSQWSSMLGVDGLPIEYSWKWNTVSKKPEIRYTIEPIGPFSGTELDPLNHDASRELLHRLKVAMPSIDTTMTEHFLSTLFDSNRSEYVQETARGVRASTTMLVAVEFTYAQPVLKTYFIPRKLGQSPGRTLPLFKESLNKLSLENAARESVYDFLESNIEGKLLNPWTVGIDNVTPAEARLKLYCQSPHTSFKSVREIMTLGGRIHVPEAQLQDLRSLIAAATGSGRDFAEDLEIPLTTKESTVETASTETLPEQSGFLYYFDLGAGASATLPEIKLYVLSRYYGPNDKSLAYGITQWMKEHGRGQYCEGYVSVLHELCDRKVLDDKVKGLHSYVSCMFKKNGDLDITSYLAPKISATTDSILQPMDKVMKTRSTRRRGSNELL